MGAALPLYDTLYVLNDLHCIGVGRKMIKYGTQTFEWQSYIFSPKVCRNIIQSHLVSRRIFTRLGVERRRWMMLQMPQDPGYHGQRTCNRSVCCIQFCSTC